MKHSILYRLMVLVLIFGFYVIGFDSSLNFTGSRVMASSISDTDFITTTNYANRQLEYYYYIPASIVNNYTKRVPYLIMVPGLSGKGEYLVTPQFKSFAEREGFVIIAPSFMEDSNNWESQTSYQYPQAWSGNALNNILRSFSSKHSLSPSCLYMFGFSAGAQFVSRYSQIYPDFVKACAFNAAGGTDYPCKYQATKFFVAIGTQDENVRKEVAQDFYSAAKQKGISVIYKQYNVGHDLCDEEINDELEFFSRVKDGY